MPDAAVVYFAAPLFTMAERRWNAELAAAIKLRGFDVLLPQDQAREHISQHGFNPKDLFDLSLRSIAAADAVVAILDGPDPDSGTCFECGVAWAAKKPIVAVRTDLRAGGDSDDAGQHEQEEKAVNLMLSESAARIVKLSALNDPPLEALADRIASALTAVLP